MKRGWILIILLFSLTFTYGQKKPSDDLIQLSGVVASGDTIEPIPYTNIFIKNRGIGTVTDFDGFFSIVVHLGDTLEFSHVGFHTDIFVVPDTLERKHYSMIQLLASDTVMLPGVDVFPWPSKAQFQEYFLSMEVPMDDVDLANRNLALAQIREQALKMGMDADEATRYMIDVQSRQMYNYGRYYGTNGGTAILGALSNPFAWAEFFRALKRGDFNSK
jgi:hypothetical protein